jgi:hypothetical protein
LILGISRSASWPSKAATTVGMWPYQRASGSQPLTLMGRPHPTLSYRMKLRAPFSLITIQL